MRNPLQVIANSFSKVIKSPTKIKYSELNPLDKFFVQDTILPLVSLIIFYNYSSPLIYDARTRKLSPFKENNLENIRWYKEKSKRTLELLGTVTVIESISCTCDPSWDKRYQTIAINFAINDSHYQLQFALNRYTVSQVRRDAVILVEIVDLNNKTEKEVVRFPSCSTNIFPSFEEIVKMLDKYDII
jgi:hypothetical protein